MLRPFLFILIACIGTSRLMAHAVGEDYLFLDIREHAIEGYVEIFLDDLESKVGLTLYENGEASERLIKQTAPQALDFIRKGVSIGTETETFEMKFGAQSLYVIEKGPMAQYFFRIELEKVPDVLTIKHDMLYSGDPLHRGLVVLDNNAKTGQAYGGENAVLVYSRFNTVQQLDLLDPPKIIWKSREMIPQGVLHIWVGIDHILFLLALLIPTVLVHGAGGWRPVERFSQSFWKVLKIVTVFTVAHSVTLALAALDILSVPSRLVESVIALSIALVALNNIFRKFKDGSLVAVFLLGLFHGLGFASVLGDLPFRTINLMRSIIGFNIGVELGQISIVLLVFPVLFLLRRKPLYVPLILKGGSALLIAIAGYWFVERAFGIG